MVVNKATVAAEVVMATTVETKATGEPVVIDERSLSPL
jgi:hypothetical protein